MRLSEVRTGDTVCRMLGGSIPMNLQVSSVTDNEIYCGPWTFDRFTGAEIDDLLGWGAPPLHTGSYILTEVPGGQDDK